MDRVANALAQVGALSEAPTISRTIDVFQAAIEPFGVQFYRTMAIGNPMRPPIDAAVVSNYSDEWLAFYRGTRAFTFDPVLCTAIKGEGFFWRDLPPPTSAEVKSFMNDSREAGLIDGFTVVRRLPGELVRAIYLSGAELEWTELERGVVNLLCNTLMSRVLHLREVQLVPAVQRLTRREAEILNFAAVGRTDKQIAQRVGISPETIHTYWKQIRAKLSASDRAHAVAVGLWCGQIAL